MSVRWLHGARAMVSVNAIFAGLSGALLSIFDRQVDKGSSGAATGLLATFLATHATFIGLLTAILAIFCFAFAAEQVTEALDEGSVKVYIWSMELHNLGVVSALVSLAALLWLKFSPQQWFWWPIAAALYWINHFCYLLPRANRITHANSISKDEPTAAP
jgi:hypothetical protein